MSGKSLMYNIKGEVPKVVTAKLSNDHVSIEAKPATGKKQNVIKSGKDTGSTIDKIEPVVNEVIEETTAVEIIEDTKIDDETVIDDVNPDTIVNDDDTVIE